jgi:hypothetical protein
MGFRPPLPRPKPAPKKAPKPKAHPVLSAKTQPKSPVQPCK